MFDRKTSALKTAVHGVTAQGSAFDLRSAALATLRQYGFEAQFPSDVAEQLARIAAEPPPSAPILTALPISRWP